MPAPPVAAPKGVWPLEIAKPTPAAAVPAMPVATAPATGVGALDPKFPAAAAAAAAAPAASLSGTGKQVAQQQYSAAALEEAYQLGREDAAVATKLQVAQKQIRAPPASVRGVEAEVPAADNAQGLSVAEARAYAQGRAEAERVTSLRAARKRAAEWAPPRSECNPGLTGSRDSPR